MDLIHHLIHFILYSALLWQVVIGCYVLLIWVSKNFKFHKSPNFNIGEVIKTSTIEETKVKKNMGPIEVGVNKKMIVDTTTDEVSVKLDEKIKGKVKTQKDKLRSLRK